MRSEKVFSSFTTAGAVNTPPILTGTAYNFNAFLAGVNTLDTFTFSVGAIANVAAGDLFVDRSTGATGLIASVNSGGGSLTINTPSTAAALFDGGAFEIHKAPKNLSTAGRKARPIVDADTATLVCVAYTPAGTSFVWQAYVWNPTTGRWYPQGGGTSTTTAGTAVPYQVALAVDGYSPRIAEGTAYTYNNTTGKVTSITFKNADSIWSVYAGAIFVLEKAGAYSQATRATIRAVDYANATIVLDAALTTATMDGHSFYIEPPQNSCMLDFYVSAVTGTTPFCRISNKVVLSE